LPPFHGIACGRNTTSGKRRDGCPTAFCSLYSAATIAHSQVFGKTGDRQGSIAAGTVQASGKLPVISPISANEKGESYDVNADSAAAALAAAALCTDLVFITDVPGVLVDNQTRASLTAKEAQTLITNGIIKGGMVAKMESAFEALTRNVPRVHIIQWQGIETLLRLVNKKYISGTVIQSK